MAIVPLSPASHSRFASAVLIDPGHPQRASVEAFVARVYRQRYGAVLRGFLPHLLAYCAADGTLRAALGLRCASEGELFVEHYLERPAELAIAERVPRRVARSELVEVGNFAAEQAGDARAMIQALTGTLHAAGLRWVLFVATRQLRNTFDRLHLATVDLGEARGERLRGDPSDWGEYYAAQPRLTFGDIAAGHAFLQRDVAPRQDTMSLFQAGVFRGCMAGAP
ncbi:thermostable hemolysin [Xanthomonas campestris pv. phormiicola]|nr:thermostable hemolysin [Xanthomonas campestris pv. phormiicola]UYC17191.1 thermostable hemolysin [Xanthomonas campestris pv. phormiicola]